MLFERKGTLWLGRFGMLHAHTKVEHGFSTRGGGVSGGPYRSLNIGTKTDDDPDRVRQNRERVFSCFPAFAEAAVIPGQVHGDAIRIVREPGQLPGTDGTATDVPGLLLTVQVADCMAVYAYDPENRAIALIHAGWRGTEKKIVRTMVKALETHFGSRAASLIVFAGPSIGPCCYEVGPETAARFEGRFLYGSRLDLRKANRVQLLESGVLEENISISGLCTACHPEWFFSHRRDSGKTGRMIAVLGIRKTA